MVYFYIENQNVLGVRPRPNSIRNEAAYPDGSGFFAFKMRQKASLDLCDLFAYSYCSMFGSQPNIPKRQEL
ncbi:hypothetical protein C9J52_21130 [Photobacterium iliopiscarium]|uniref:Uncharacterized protein n=2 Tax=Photobacterium iliopiscarium TaxID=56192 RepID=A0ABX5GLH9_9GAMM|nr:hypothetical protein C9J52_21130 [Photobacterium iliopiscarium]